MKIEEAIAILEKRKHCIEEGSEICDTNFCNDCQYNYTLVETNEAEKLAIEAMEEKRTMIYCKDCIHWQKLNDVAGCTDAVRVCDLAYWMVGEFGFCVYAEGIKDER